MRGEPGGDDGPGLADGGAPGGCGRLGAGDGVVRQLTETVTGWPARLLTAWASWRAGGGDEEPSSVTLTASALRVSSAILSALAPPPASHDWTRERICARVSGADPVPWPEAAEVLWYQRTSTAARGPSTVVRDLARLVVGGGAVDPVTSTVTRVPLTLVPVRVSAGSAPSQLTAAWFTAWVVWAWLALASVVAVSCAVTTTAAATTATNPARIRPAAARRRPDGTKPQATGTTEPTSTIATRFAANSSRAPLARSSRPMARVNPVADSGGTRATATATPGSAAETSSRAVA